MFLKSHKTGRLRSNLLPTSVAKNTIFHLKYFIWQTLKHNQAFWKKKLLVDEDNIN